VKRREGFYELFEPLVELVEPLDELVERHC